jgi:twitching motility two-component system response regulator PilH
MARILIVEDSPAQAAIISEIVKEAGHEAMVCKEFTKGVVPMLHPAVPDLVLLDLILLDHDGKPVGDGFQICREIKRLSKNTVAVVVVSAKEDDMSAEWALMQGADAFLQKPFAVDDLLGVMKEALAVMGK